MINLYSLKRWNKYIIINKISIIMTSLVTQKTLDNPFNICPRELNKCMIIIALIYDMSINISLYNADKIYLLNLCPFAAMSAKIAIFVLFWNLSFWHRYISVSIIIRSIRSLISNSMTNRRLDLKHQNICFYFLSFQRLMRYNRSLTII